MRTRLVLLVLSVALVGFAPAPFPRTERSRVDHTDVGGTWEFIAWEYNGRREQGYEKTYKAEVTREKFELTGGGGTYKMRLDTTVSPPAFTWTYGESVSHVGSYRLKGNEITMVFVSGDRVERRPLDFTTPPQSGWRFTMRRVKRD